MIILHKKNRETGFTLVEVLVSLVILSVGLLGLAGLQITGLQGSNSAYMRSAAMIHANDMTDRIRANRAGAGTAGDYEFEFGVDAIPTAPPALTVAEQDIVDWLTALANDPGRGGLPNGGGSIAFIDAPLTVTVTVEWTDNIFGGGVANVTVVTRL